MGEPLVKYLTLYTIHVFLTEIQYFTPAVNDDSSFTIFTQVFCFDLLYTNNNNKANFNLLEVTFVLFIPETNFTYC